MPITIDKLDVSVNDAYARRIQARYELNRQIHIDDAASIPPQIQILNSYAQLSELDLLLGVVPNLPAWAYFQPPKNFFKKRKSPFSFARVLPSLNSTDEEEEEFQNLEDIVCKTPDEEMEKSIIKNCFKEVSKINKWLSFIVGRVGQFLQG